MAKSKKPIEKRTYKTEEARAQAYARSKASKRYSNRRRCTYPTYAFIGPLLHPDACPF